MPVDYGGVLAAKTSDSPVKPYLADPSDASDLSDVNAERPPGTVWLWPVEYNAYGPGNTRIIVRPDGSKDYPIVDHLGSVRLLLGDDGVIKEQRSYGPFGEDLISDGDGARTSYIGRENDHESNLGSFGVRHYDPTHGRFMSVDPLWAKYAPLQPYHYAGNEPVGRLDWDGKEITYVGKNQKIINALKHFYQSAIDHFVKRGAFEAANMLSFIRDTDKFRIKLRYTPTTRVYPSDEDADGQRDLKIGYLPRNNEIRINPAVGAELENGWMSPFEVLHHEVSHAYINNWIDPYDCDVSSSCEDPTVYEDCEEETVILQYETPLLRILGQLFDQSKPSRPNHDGGFCVPDPAIEKQLKIWRER